MMILYHFENNNLGFRMQYETGNYLEKKIKY